MAGIDKIYGSWQEYMQLKEFLAANKPKYLKYLYPEPEFDARFAPISNFPCEADKWLWENCSLQFVLDRLKDQYNGHP